MTYAATARPVPPLALLRERSTGLWSAPGARNAVNLQTFTPTQGANRTVTDIFIGGCNDPRTRLVADYALTYARRNRARETVYFRQSEGRALQRFLRRLPTDALVNIVAHSWGVPTACRAVIRVGRPIALLIAVDPVNRNPLGLLPEARELGNVRRIVDIAATGSARHWDEGNAVARLGRFWCGGQPRALRDTRTERLTAPYPHSMFARLFEHRGADGWSGADILRHA